MCARQPVAPHRLAVLEERARFMRHAMTKGEALLWSRLRRGQLGVVFRRQVPLGGKYIADLQAPPSPASAPRSRSQSDPPQDFAKRPTRPRAGMPAAHAGPTKSGVTHPAPAAHPALLIAELSAR